MKDHVVIIGGGIIGYCCAYYLSQAGYRVTIIEKATRPISASYGNAGMIVPSHFTPLASPALLKKGLKWMFSSSSPFYLRPRLNLDLALWIRKFLQSANSNFVEYAAPKICELSLLSRELYNGINQTLGNRIDFHGDGLLMIYNTRKGEEEELKASLAANDLGLETEILDHKMLNQKDTGTYYEARGAVYYPQDAFLDPAKLMQSLETYLRNGNVRIIKGRQVKGFKFSGSSMKTVHCLEEDVDGDHFVIASGAHSAGLLRKLGTRLLLQGGKGYSIDVKEPGEMPGICSILTEVRVTVTPMGSSLRFAGALEIAGLDTSINPKRVKGFLRSIPNYIPHFTYNELRKNEVWAGLRPCSADGLPYIGRLKSIHNIVVATGHLMMGLSLGPVTGKLVSELIMEEEPSVDVSPFSPNR